jgi:hypothetical protein
MSADQTAYAHLIEFVIYHSLTTIGMERALWQGRFHQKRATNFCGS